MIVYAYSGLRPSSTTRLSKVARIVEAKEEENENEEEGEELAKLQYGDFVLEHAKYERGRVRLVVRPLFWHFKGESLRASWQNSQPGLLTQRATMAPIRSTLEPVVVVADL